MRFDSRPLMEKRFLLLDASDVGIAVFDSKRIAAAAGFDERDQVLISTVVSELATNIIRYAGHGEIQVKVVKNLGREGIEVLATDEGPGIKNIKQAMQDHFTTTPHSLGMGLSSVKRMMDEFQVDSSPSSGTRILTRKWKSGQHHPHVDYFCAIRSLLGPIEECGDMGVIEVEGDTCFMGLIDAVGHGDKAYEIAFTAKKYIQEHFRRNLVDLMNGLHDQLKQTRGAIITLCRLNFATGEAVLCGVGNICTRILGPRHLRILSTDGIVGYIMSTPKEKRFKLYPGDILVMTSDGVGEHFDPVDCLDIFSGSAEKIAKELIKRFGKENDDASCLTVRLVL